MSQIPAVAPRSVVCVFATAELAAASCLGPDGWTDQTDVGVCRFVPAVLGVGEVPAAGALVGIFQGASCTPQAARQWHALLTLAGRSKQAIDLVAVDEVVSVYVWLAEHLADFTAAFHQDDNVDLSLPSWWRRRVELHLSHHEGVASHARNNATTTIFSPDAVRAARARIYPDMR